jgi:hypothetical protein
LPGFYVTRTEFWNHRNDRTRQEPKPSRTSNLQTIETLGIDFGISIKNQKGELATFLSQSLHPETHSKTF